MARYGSTAALPGSALQERRDVEVAPLARRTPLLGLRRTEVAARPAAATAEARGDDGHPDLAVQPVGDGRSEDDVRVGGRGGGEHLGGLFDLDEGQVSPPAIESR